MSVHLHVAVGKGLRAAFYQLLVPSASVAALMAPCQARFEGKYVVGIHIRQVSKDG